LPKLVRLFQSGSHYNTTSLTATHILQRCSYVYLRIYNPGPHVSSHLHAYTARPSPVASAAQLPNPHLKKLTIPEPPFSASLNPSSSQAPDLQAIRRRGHSPRLVAYLSFPKAAPGLLRSAGARLQRGSPGRRDLSPGDQAHGSDHSQVSAATCRAMFRDGNVRSNSWVFYGDWRICK
jgi:hypothetical protein